MIKESTGIYIPQFNDKVNFLKSDIKNFIKNLKYRKNCFARYERNSMTYFLWYSTLKGGIQVWQTG